MKEYEVMNVSEKLSFLAELSTMYYELNMTQAEIADRLSTTRFKVSKLLQEARNKNVVQITINQPIERVYDIENQLKDRFNLKEAIVLDNKVLPYEETLYTLGKLGAEYLDNIITENSIIGVLWGTTMFNLVKNLKPRKKLPITAVQILGAAAKDNPIVDAPELIRQIASAYGGKYKYLYAPLYIDNDYARKALIQEPFINDTLFLANKADIVITGIGTIDALTSSTLWSNYLAKRNELSKQKATGCVFAHVFDIDGKEVNVDINQKVIGVDLDTLRQVEYKVGIAAGKFKAEAILGALRGKYINVLITDDRTATKVLSLDDFHQDYKVKEQN